MTLASLVAIHHPTSFNNNNDATQSSLPTQLLPTVVSQVNPNALTDESLPSFQTSLTDEATPPPPPRRPTEQKPTEFDVSSGLFETTMNLDNFEQPVVNMEAFLQELSDDSSTGGGGGGDQLGLMEQICAQQEIEFSNHHHHHHQISHPLGAGFTSLADFTNSMNLISSPTSTNNQGLAANLAPSLEDWNMNCCSQFNQGHSTGWPVLDPSKTIQHFTSLSFDAMHQAANLHLWTVGPVSDMTIFYLFRKVHSKEQANRAVDALMKDRECRNYRRNTTPYSEVASAAVFNALNRTGGEDLVVAAAEKATELGLTLSRSNMYHLMKQYSVQGKVEHVEKLFRALENAGKSWNSNCIVIMMLAYFNRGKFEEADQLRHELKSRGIKISERIENRLELLLSGEERWRWEDQVYFRPRQVHHLSPPPGFGPIRDTVSPIKNRNFSLSNGCVHVNTGALVVDPYQDHAEGYMLRELPRPTLRDAVKEPRVHLNILRAAGFSDLHNVLLEFVRTEGPVENVCISFMFRKVETKEDAEKAMQFLEEERAARTQAGISEEYNETTCSRIFTALFRTGAPDLAFIYAKNASETGLVLSGKALHELLKSFATRNEVEKVEQIWSLVKINGKPSSRIVYSIFRTYFDNGMMERARRFRDEIQNIGIKLSASATRNIDDVLSGAKRWVKDPHSGEF
eukprot:g5278.t1